MKLLCCALKCGQLFFSIHPSEQSLQTHPFIKSSLNKTGNNKIVIGQKTERHEQAYMELSLFIYY
jgi:uncharacterized CHY-type Zn-finger protein